MYIIFVLTSYVATAYITFCATVYNDYNTQQYSSGCTTRLNSWGCGDYAISTGITDKAVKFNYSNRTVRYLE